MEQREVKNYFKNRVFVHQIGFYAPDWKAFALGIMSALAPALSITPQTPSEG